MRQDSDGPVTGSRKMPNPLSDRNPASSITLLGICALLFLSSGIINAGINQSGALVVHTDDAYGWTDEICDNFDAWVPDSCEYFGTRVDKDESTPALIWFVAVFSCGSTPGVTSIYFGHDHNLPGNSHNHWGPCGSSGTIEFPDAGWPDAPATAGNAVMFGIPIVGDRLFPFYHVEVWGFSGAYYCTDINPIIGYAAFADDNVPAIIDETELFGCVRWYDAGYNNHGSCLPSWGACCFQNGTCYVDEFELCMSAGAYDWVPQTLCEPYPCLPPGACCFTVNNCQILCEEDCTAYGGEFVGKAIPCDPDPCSPTSGVPEISVESVTWGQIKSTYLE